MSFKAKSASTFRTKPTTTTKKSNVALLTEGASYIRRANKAGRGEPVVEKVVFDDDARREYLTGFSKRKKAKIEEKRERAKKKDHEDHLAMRRKAREDLKQRARENFISVRRAMGLPELVEEEADEGIFSDSEGAASQKGKGKAMETGTGDVEEEEGSEVEVEYQDDDQHAVVTITDDFDEDLGLGVSSGTSRKRKAGDRDDDDNLSDDGDEQNDSTSDRKSRSAVPLMPASSRKQQKKALSTAATKKSISLGFPSAKTNTSSKNHVASDYRAYETKAERKKVKEKENDRRKQKWELAKDRGTAGGRGKGSGRGRGGGRGRGRGGGGRGKK
ncbi:hypothetical protein QFC21_005359 [Naganishia friedmannii]|uniref:Uncharacterized protein n=1 Tax=Naganishia friedmannii TaxID=89922 RepID=A0ACC2VBJ5_9TREE|nr:hypothetical protein QFC21_005359 [Naganishia friedmannii]